MINLKKFFRANPHTISVAKAEKEVLEYFLVNKKEFEQWLELHPQPRIRFRFYFPTAVDFYFDDFKLFTAYFKRGAFDQPELAELKMSNENYSSICTASWKPFEEVIMHFLSTMEESNKASHFSKKRSLYEYASICEKEQPAMRQKALSQPLNTSIATG